MDYYAHSGQRADYSDWQPLAEHLRNVAKLAREFAEDARPDDKEIASAAEALGWLHDLGKYRPEFQPYIRTGHGKGESTWHKHIGAIYACNSKRYDLAFAIHGHHGGIPNKAELAEAVAREHEVLEKLWPVAIADCPELVKALNFQAANAETWEKDLRIRLLFSCLVDADWLDTSDHAAKCRGTPIYKKPPALIAEELLARVQSYVAMRAAKCGDAKIAAIRDEVFKASLAAADQTPGIFTMTVPTGGGKTLSSLAFALAHAKQFGLRRIIYVAPYLSIIEQNARVLREALGENADDLILEHHSLAEPKGGAGDNATGSDAAQRLAENWDSSVVFTTSVQFYESLFSNEPGRCRKFHNIARSVMILDECQTLPKGLTIPTCEMLQQITRYLGCTIVLCTATQPAWEKSTRLAAGLENVRPIVPASLNLFERLQRVRVIWPERDAKPMDWSVVAAKMQQKPQALCVVNSKKAARNLFWELRRIGAQNVFHLSTAMCPEHRLDVLDHVRQLLAAKRPCYLVSTQLIEAGVDVDFPLVLREIGPFESVVQAAGRCNREGLLKTISGIPGGEVIVFKSIDADLPLDAWYRNGTGIVADDFLKNGREPDIHSPDDLAEYFRRLYPTGDLDQRKISDLRAQYNFQYTAREFQIIDQATTPLVVMQWSTKKAQIEELLTEIRDYSSRRAYRQLQRYSVNVYENDLRLLAGSVSLNYLPGVNLCSLPYNDFLGLVPGNHTGALVF